MFISVVSFRIWEYNTSYESGKSCDYGVCSSGHPTYANLFVEYGQSAEQLCQTHLHPIPLLLPLLQLWVLLLR